jgi:uncharacterized membrane protein
MPKGSIFELIGITMLPIILYFINRPVTAGALAGLAINSHTAAVLTVVFFSVYCIYTRKEILT